MNHLTMLRTQLAVTLVGHSEPIVVQLHAVCAFKLCMSNKHYNHYYMYISNLGASYLFANVVGKFGAFQSHISAQEKQHTHSHIK